MLIKNIETKIKTFALVAMVSVIGSVVVAIGSFYFAYQQIDKERQKVYVLDAGVPILVNRTNQSSNRVAEYKAHINLFHNMFFTLPPDDKFIQDNLKKAMYLIDNTGLMEYNNLKEKGYYNQILSSSAVLSIMTDSVSINLRDNSFIYYGKQRIDRKTSVISREITTTGFFHDIPRTDYNPHGVLITNWQTQKNEDIDFQQKKNF